MKNFRWIRSVCAGSIRRVWMLCGTRCASAIIAVCYALLMQRAVDAAVAQDAATFWPALGLFAAVLLAQAGFTAASKWLSESAQARLENDLRAHAARAILHAGRLPQQKTSGEVASVLTSDATSVAQAMVSTVPEAVSMAVRAVAALAVMASVAPALAVLFVCAGIVCVAASLPMRRWLKRLHTGAQATEGTMRSRLQETLESLVVIRSFGAQEQVGLKLGTSADDHLDARERRAAGKTASSAVFTLAMQASYIAGFGYGCWGILTGRVSYGTLMALVQLVGQIRQPFASLSGIFPQVAALDASCERLRAVEPEAVATVAPAAGAVFESLGFHNVTFSYPGGEKVLDKFDARVQAGEFVTVTGPSGIGKSTMLLLALGMYAPQAGEVAVRFSDGKQIMAPNLAPGTFAYVPQGNMLMSGTIRDAVTFGESNNDAAKTNARLSEALHAACADEFVAALSSGVDTQLGERGSGLSEGQMQRLAVARAVYSGAPVLLLDECTSALDEATEREMLTRLRALGRTAIIVTHRPAALAVCEREINLKGTLEH